ncbi:uncharacterized protein JCM15063_005442 [Sporobolomyces koalae]|uniref:uncharacterized protein n=1 Tax=Sporobolomyces koalae TaxID=500713 RepID=UPI0031826A7D
MGRSAKFAKRPNKAEKVARQINKPISSHNRERSLSPETDQPRSEIPLFNTSAKGRQYSHKPDPRKVNSMIEDDGAQEMQVAQEDDEGAEAEEAPGGKRKKNLKDKLKAANQALDRDSEKTERKLGAKYKKGGKGGPILGGKDYVKMLESRPGGAFKHKKLR